MTATALTATATTANTTINDDPQPQVLTAGQSWSCNTCQISFDDGLAQRAHMKSPWHVYNLKRKIASLPPISLAIFQDQIEEEPKRRSPEKHSRDYDTSEVETESLSPYHCLFCEQTFVNANEDLQPILEHMTTSHGLFIPDQNSLSDIASFLGYLGTTVRVWHECLYCGTSRTSTTAIQSHMRDSGHCMLNLEREPELSDFWEPRDNHVQRLVSMSARKARVSTHDLAVLSIKTAGKRRAPARRTDPPHSQDTSLVPRHNPDNPPPLNFRTAQPSRQLARREEMGLTNITPQQRRALIVAEKKAQKAQEVSSRASEWSYARKANAQKHDQDHGPLACYKGGNHKLLPR
ncbi:hypothetical protein ACN47E_003658 [Coniothyrium glycines]